MVVPEGRGKPTGRGKPRPYSTRAWQADPLDSRDGAGGHPGP